jgi:hypothetical protein
MTRSKNPVEKQIKMTNREELQTLRNLLDQLLENIQLLSTQFKSQLDLEVGNLVSAQNERAKNYSLLDSEWKLIKHAFSKILSGIGNNINDALIATNSIEKNIRILENEDIKFKSVQFQLPSQIDSFISRIKNLVKIYIQQASPNEISGSDGIFADDIFLDRSYSEEQAIDTKNVRSAAKKFQQKTEPLHKDYVGNAAKMFKQRQDIQPLPEKVLIINIECYQISG